MGRIEQVVKSFEALAQGMHPSVALAQEGGVVLQSLGPEDRAFHSFSVGGEKISSAEFLEGWRAKI